MEEKNEVKTTAATAQPVQAVQPAPQAEPVKAPEAKVEAKPEEAKPVVQPAAEPAPKPEVVPQPAQEPAPKPQPLPQPAESQPTTPVQTAQVVEQAPAAPAQPAAPVAEKPAEPVAATTQEVAPQAVAPTPPVGETIKEAPALDPIANNPQPAAQPDQPAPTTEASTTGNIAPAAPLETSMDTNIGFVAVSDNLKKKKNKPLIATIVIVLLIGLGALGYFVVYPYIVKTYIAKPKNVYNYVIDNAFKSINSTVDTVAHSRVIYDIEAQIDTNIEEIKDLNGYTYAANFGIDPEGKNLQGGLRIKDSSSQEHSASIYVKGDRQYLRLSSYRELIFMGTTEKYEQLWNDLYQRFNNVNDEEYEYLINKLSTLFKDSIVESKLTKEDASITINNKKYKVLNHKYTINNETMNSMIKSILNGLAKDDKALSIIAKNFQLNADDLKKDFDSYDDSKKVLEDDKVIVVNIYTYPTKTQALGFKIENGDNNILYYSVDGYFEFKAHSLSNNEVTGKEEETNFVVIGEKNDGKTNVSITLNEKEIAKLVVSAWDDKTIDFKYEINSDEQKVTGAIKINIDTSDTKSKVTFSGSLNSGSDYLKLSLTINNDWSSDVANINVATAKDNLSEAEIEMKINEFIGSLKETPLFKIFSTVSGDYLPPDLQTAKPIEAPTNTTYNYSNNNNLSGNEA